MSRGCIWDAAHPHTSMSTCKKYVLFCKSKYPEKLDVSMIQLGTVGKRAQNLIILLFIFRKIKKIFWRFSSSSWNKREQLLKKKGGGGENGSLVYCIIP